MRFISKKQQDEFIRHYLQGLDVPRSLTVWLLYSNNEHEQLADLDFIPDNYLDIESARSSLSATKYLSKATFLNLDRDLRVEALNKFNEAELVCKETNRRIIESKYKNTLTASALLSMSRKIDYILGSFDAEDFVNNCNFGPGATTLLRRSDASHPKKFDFENRITREAYDFVNPWFHLCYPPWKVKFDIIGNSKIVTVPKNAKTDRTIAIEPGINLWFQKGLGSLIRKRLKRFGIDLNDQSHNQKKCRIASKFNHLATVDFSAASDTISKELVKQILPQKWCILLDTFRSSFGLLDGEYIHYEKYSSMGNGFTFELETLIFYTLALACCELSGVDDSDVSVYGDDVLIPSCVFDMYDSISKDLGFTINRQKSYSSGYFRESCGSYYWNGVCIKPIFLKEPISGKAQLLLAANNIRRLSHRRNSYGCDIRLRSCFQYAETILDNLSISRISDGYGDIGLIENIDHPKVKVTVSDRGYEGHYVRVWAPLAYTIYGESYGLLLSKVKAMGASDPFYQLYKSNWWERIEDANSIGNKIPIVGRTRHARIRMLIPRWHDLGPWC